MASIGALCLAQDFHRDGALSGNHIRVVVGMHERQVTALRELARVHIRLVVGVAVQYDFGAARGDRRDLDLRRRHGHHDGRLAFELLRRERDPLRMVAGGGGDHAALERRRGQLRHLVVRAAQLEREHRLHVLALEQQACCSSRADRLGARSSGVSIATS